jgi:hypothetical protein
MSWHAPQRPSKLPLSCPENAVACNSQALKPARILQDPAGKAVPLTCACITCRQRVWLEVAYRRLARYCTSWDCFVSGTYPRSLCDFQVCLPRNSGPSTIFSKAMVLATCSDRISSPHNACQQRAALAMHARSQLCSQCTAKGNQAFNFKFPCFPTDL